MRERLDPAAIPAHVAKVASALRAASGRAFLVGGPVRDLLLGRMPADWDIATDLSPDDVLRVFPGATTVGIEFGRVEVDGVDVVSLRGESGYLDRRHPSFVTFGVPVEEDLKRRDFTINAMAAEFDELAVIDPFGGREDLARRLVRTVGDPRERLAEDPLRILRVVRFKTLLDMDLDPAISGLLPEVTGTLATVSGERVFSELARILVSPAVCQGMRDLIAYGLGPIVLPEVFVGGEGDGAIAERTGRAMSLASLDLVTRLAVLFAVGAGDLYLGSALGATHDQREALCASEAAFDRFNVPSSLRRDVAWLLRGVGDSGLVGRALAGGENNAAYLARKLVDEAGREQVSRLVDVEQSAWRAAENQGLPGAAAAVAAGLREAGGEAAAVPGTLALTGEDVMAILGKRGPVVGEALGYLKEAVLRDPSRNRRDLLEDALREWWRRR
jgi:tRNA nucleotidyltransferase (CCA-adding enzyme)